MVLLYRVGGYSIYNEFYLHFNSMGVWSKLNSELDDDVKWIYSLSDSKIYKILIADDQLKGLSIDIGIKDNLFLT